MSPAKILLVKSVDSHVSWQQSAYRALWRALTLRGHKVEWIRRRELIYLAVTTVENERVTQRRHMVYRLQLDPSKAGMKAVLVDFVDVPQGLESELTPLELEALQKVSAVPTSCWCAATSDGQSVPLVDFAHHNSSSPAWRGVSKEDAAKFLRVQATEEIQVIRV